MLFQPTNKKFWSYPTAFPRSTGIYAAYPWQGNYPYKNQTSSCVVRTRSARSKQPPATGFTWPWSAVTNTTKQSAPPRNNPALTGGLGSYLKSYWRWEQQCFAWIAQAWQGQLNSTQRASWASLLSWMNHHYSYSPTWKQNTRPRYAFDLYMQWNLCSRRVQQSITAPVNFALPVPWPTAPATYDPPNITSFAAAIFTNLNNSYATLPRSPSNTVYYSTFIGYPNVWPRLYMQQQLIATDSGIFDPGQFLIGADFVELAFSSVKIGQFYAVGARAINYNDGSPSPLQIALVTVTS
jgi:hypothetical protein